MDSTSPCTPTDSEAPSPRPWYRRRPTIVLGCLLICLIAGFLVLTYVPLGSGEGGIGADLSFHATKFNANNRLNATASTISSAHARFACRRILILNRSDHRIMRQVARKVADQLDATDLIDTADAFDFADRSGWPEAGGDLYDLYIVIDMPKFDVSGVIVTGRTVDAKVTAHLGQTLWTSHRGYTDHLTPPLVRVSADLTLDHNSVSTGYESASARYGQVIDNIAKQLGDHLIKRLQGLAAQYGQIDHMPTGLMPPYRPTPNDLPLPADPGLTRVISGRGLMMPNFTTWTLESSDPLSVLRDLRDRLKAAGWRVGSQPIDDSWQYHLRATDKGRVYEAFEVRRDGGRVAGEQAELVIAYTDRMTREEMRPVFERMLADNTTPVTTLLLFSRNVDHDLNERLTELLIERGNLPVAAELRIVRYLHAHGKAEQAMARLRRTYIARLMAVDDNVDEIKKLGRKITEDEQWEPPPLTVQELEALGVRRIDTEQPLTAEVAMGEPAVFFQHVEQADGSTKLGLIGITVTRSKIPEGRYTLNLTNRSPGKGGGGSCSSTPHGSASPWHASTAFGFNADYWCAEADEIADDRFRVTLTMRVDGSKDKKER